MKNLAKALLALTVIGSFIYLLSIAPKGNDYIEWERTMIESGQINASNTEYFK